MEELILDKNCFKIDRTNAKAMIQGFEKNGKNIHTAIYLVGENRTFPKLITLHKHYLKFEKELISKIGRKLNSENFSMPYKYIAIVKPNWVYDVKNEKELWKKLCNNELFDIWLPEAPFERFVGSQRKHCKILLLRIYEINETIPENEILSYASNNRCHKLKNGNLRVTIKKPVISDEEFNERKKLLEKSIRNFQMPKNERNIL